MEFLNNNQASNAQGANEANNAIKSTVTTANASAKPKAQEPAKGAETKIGSKAPEPKKDVKLLPEATKPEEPKQILVAAKPQALGLEATLKVLKDLHRESIKRDNLLDRLAQLEEFEILQAEDADELENNVFAGCKLAIYDGQGRQFITNTSGLIKLTADFIKKSCLDKLAEIEANIIFPTAA